MSNNIFSIALYNYDKLKKIKIKENIDLKSMDIIGMYDKKNNIWMWGYLFFNTKMKKIFDIIYDNNNDDNINNMIRYTFLNSKFILSDNLQLDIILSLSTYYLKSNKLMIIEINDYYTYYASIIEP